MVYLNQLEYEDVPYEHNLDAGGPPPGKGNAAAAACGPCCLCMMVGNLTMGQLDLLDCLKMSADLGANRKLGTDLKILGPAVAEMYGLEFSVTDDVHVMAEHVRRGGMAIANSGGDREGYTGLFTHGGHYISVISVDGEEACILDPSYKPGKYDEEGRQGKVTVSEPFVYCPLDILMKDCENRSPAFYLFRRKQRSGSAKEKESVMEVKEIISEIKKKMEERGGLKHVYFVACGGSKAAIFPGLYLLQSEAKTFGATTYTSNEFVHATPKELDERCVAVICSLKATPETVRAVETANAAGAVTIAMTGSMETGMAKVGQYVVTYSNGDEQVYSDSNQANALRIGFELLHQIEGWEKYEKAMEAYQHIDEIVAEGKKNCLEAAKEWAEKEKDEPIFYVLASGPNYGVAYSMCCCHFMEMQWKHAVCLHTGEYFHGPFETTDKKLPMVLIMSEGRTRELDERCLRFLKTYAENYIVIDFKELNQGRIDAEVAEFFNPVVLIPIERYYVSQMAEIRNHSMDHRRYMWKVEY